MDTSNKLKIGETTVSGIEWDMTPDLAFCTFSAKGLRKELISSSELICYFFIDNWGDEPRLYLMERGVRHVNILAEVKAPLAMMIDCISAPGTTSTAKGNYPVNDALKGWLLTEVVEPEESPYLVPVVEEKSVKEDMGAALPALKDTSFNGDKVVLPAEQSTLRDEHIATIIKQWNFYDSVLNPQGSFENGLADPDDNLIVVDKRTGLMWQRAGLDICSIRSMTRRVEQLNEEGFAGYHDWRMPTVEEAMSLMETSPNTKGLYLPLCFSKEQPFIFVATRRKPTGYWFVDYKQGKVYWASGTVPGGFCRLCRRAD